MKKLFILLLVACFVFNSSAQIQDEDFSHFSINLKGGASFMRDYGISVGKKERINYLAGADLEYTFNPLWGLGLNYTYMPYGQDYGTLGKVTATANEITAYASVNLSNLLAQYRSCQKLNIYANAGGGVGFLDYDNTNSGKKGNSKCLVLPAGLSMEYNFSDLFAMSLGGEYRWHNDANMKMDVTNSSAQGNGFLIANIGFRFKFGGEKRHVRNISYTSFQNVRMEDKYAPLIIAQQEEIRILAAKTLEQTVITRGVEAELRNQSAAIKDLENKLSNYSSMDKKTAEEIAAIKKAQETISKDVFNALEFETGSSTIKSKSFKALEKLAELMNTNPSWKLTLKGYTDSSGSLEKNIQLSKDRANAVKLFLMSKDVSGDRISSDGYGPENPIAPNNTAQGRAQNRRVEIQID